MRRGSAPGFCPEAKYYFDFIGGILPKVAWLAAGRQMPDGFTVWGDVQKSSSNVLLQMSTDGETADLPNSVTVSTVPLDDGLGGVFHSIKIPVSGLAPNTRYYYRVILNGQPTDDGWRSIKTRPTDGVATPFTCVVGTCAKIRSTSVLTAANKVAELQPDLIVFIGDAGYSNIATDDIGLARRACFRQFLANPQVQLMLRHSGLALMPDDHDYGPNNGNVDMLDGLLATVFANARQVYNESVPHWDYADANSPLRCLAQSVRWGKVGLLFLDTRGQRTLLGTPTVLGTGSNPPGSFDQLTWAQNEILASVARGDNRLLHFVPTGIPANYAGGWAMDAPDEYAYYTGYTEANDGGLSVYRTGDVHKWFIRGGPDVPRPIICDSPFHNGNTLTAGGPGLWLGSQEDGELANNARTFSLTTVDVDGEWTLDVYGKNGEGSSPEEAAVVLKKNFDSRDLL